MDKNYITKKVRTIKGVRVPDFLIKSYIAQTSKILYAVLLDRTLKEKNEDNRGYLYIECPIEDMASELMRSMSTIKRSLLELELGGFIRRRRSDAGKPVTIYVLY